MQPHIFKYEHTRYKSFLKPIILRNSLIFGGLILFLLAYAYFSLDFTEIDFNEVLQDNILSLCIFCIFFIILLFTRNSMLKTIYYSYEIEITDIHIIRKANIVGNLSVLKSGITEILKTQKGGFIIKSKDTNVILFIPHYIENPDYLTEVLSTVQAVKPQSAVSFWEKYKFYSPILLLFLIRISTSIIDNKIFHVVCMLLFMGVSIYGLVLMLKIKPKNNWVLFGIAIALFYVITSLITIFLLLTNIISLTPS